MKLLSNRIAIFLPLLIVCLASCRKNQSTVSTDDNNIFQEAVFIKGTPRGDNAMHIAIINPWDSTAMLAEYDLFNNGASTSDDAAQTADSQSATLRIKLPLKRLIVYSSVHASLLAELGYVDAIVGVADADYIKTPEIRQRISDGRIVDIGSSLEPSLEKIIALKPDAIMLSPFQNAGHGVVDKAGVPVIECADYMESTPLGRAEWSKFYAMLVEGICDKNNVTFDQASKSYHALAAKAATYKEKPRVITEMQDRGMWLVPGGDSYAARLLTDAGADYPFLSKKNPGSVTMNYEQVYMAAQDVDFWLVKSYGKDLTLEDIAKNHPFNKKFWAYSHNGIYNANTEHSNLYEETPFHPDRLLADYVAIFHQTGDSLRYYAPVR